jgi:hypothetical protein
MPAVNGPHLKLCSPVIKAACPTFSIRSRTLKAVDPLHHVQGQESPKKNVS